MVSEWWIQMKVGIVGAGNIVLHCLEAIDQLDDLECVSLCVLESDLEVANKIASRFNIPDISTDYEQFLLKDNVDVVYLGIPNKFHYQYAKKALEFNKHVVNEKPFSSNYEEALELVELAKEKKLFLFEAITTIYSPNVIALKKKLNELENVKLVQSNYSQLSSRYANYLKGSVHPAFDPKMSGGSLYDINIYNVHLSCFLFGEPESIDYVANKGFNGIDTSGVLILKYPNFISICVGAKDSNSQSQTIIQGVNGYLKLCSAPNTATSLEFNIGGSLETINENKHENHMIYEFQAFKEMMSNHDYEGCYKNLEHSLCVMKVLTEARQLAEIDFS